MKSLSYSPAALRDLENITAYIAEDNPDRAVSFVAELRALATTLKEFPQRFPARDDIHPGLRAAVHGNYVLFYRVDTHEIRIERVLHGARDLGAMFSEE